LPRFHRQPPAVAVAVGNKVTEFWFTRRAEEVKFQLRAKPLLQAKFQSQAGIQSLANLLQARKRVEVPSRERLPAAAAG